MTSNIVSRRCGLFDPTTKEPQLYATDTPILRTTEFRPVSIKEAERLGDNMVEHGGWNEDKEALILVRNK